MCPLIPWDGKLSLQEPGANFLFDQKEEPDLAETLSGV